MIPICVDPSTLVLSSKLGDAAYIEGAIERIRFVHRAVTTPKLIVIGCDDLVSVLAGQDLLPLYESIAEILRNNGLSEYYSPSDISRLIYEILERSSGISLHSIVDELLVEDASFSPPGNSLAVLPQIHDALAELFAHVSVSRKERADWQPGLTAAMGPAFAGSPSIRFEGSMSLISPRVGTPPSDTLAAAVVLPQVASLEDVLLGIDPQLIWARSEDEAGLSLAIKAGGLHVMRANGIQPDIGAIREVSLGRGFLRSLGDTDSIGTGQYASVVSQACFRISGNVAGALGDRFMVGVRSRATEQRKRDDGALAYRLQLTGSHQALRLMSWHLPDDRVELANIGNKADEEIW